MTGVQRAQELYEARRAELNRLRKELEGEVEETRLGEIREAMTKCHAAMDQAREDVKLFERSDALADQRMVRADVTAAQPASAQRDLTPPTVEDFRLRGELQYLQARGHSLTEEQSVVAARTYPVEDLFARVQVLRASGRLDQLSHEERTAWRAYQDVAKRAVAGGLDATTNDGAEFIPTGLENTIMGAMQHYGGLGSDASVRVTRLGYYGNMDVPTITDVLTASGVGAATDAAVDKPNTGKVSFTPHKYKLRIPVSAEVMLSPVNFQSWVVDAAAQGFWRAYNTQRSVGDNSGTNFQGAWADSAAARIATTAANDTVAGPDVLALYKLIDYAYSNSPNCEVHMHSDTELDLMLLADGSGTETVAYVRFAQNGELMLPRGKQPVINNALHDGVVGAAGDDLIGIGDMNQYGVFYAAGMRVYTEYRSESDQYDMTWYQWSDGQRIQDAAFGRLENKG